MIEVEGCENEEVGEEDKEHEDVRGSEVIEEVEEHTDNDKGE